MSSTSEEVRHDVFGKMLANYSSRYLTQRVSSVSFHGDQLSKDSKTSIIKNKEKEEL